MRKTVTVTIFLLMAAFALNCAAQSGRTLEELKAETQARADRYAYPLIGLKADEVREALGRLTSLDRDEWAASWSQIGDRYMAKRDSPGVALLLVRTLAGAELGRQAA